MDTKHHKRDNIKGWAIDADPRNDPTYPMKEQSVQGSKGSQWERPPRQKTTVEILRSTERPILSAVVGESIPPRGLSGQLRRLAYRYSENEFRHWIPLLIADRINECEGIVDDLQRGTFPNFFSERGGNAVWKYNRATIIKKTSVLILLGCAWWAYRSWKRR